MDRIAIKRIYATPGTDDGCRILVDRLWPRGLRKDQARIDHWFRDLAPSHALRKWFGHEPEKWDEFRRRYHAEIETNASVLVPFYALLKSEAKITLLFAAKDETHNNAVVLAEHLRAKSLR